MTRLFNVVSILITGTLLATVTAFATPEDETEIRQLFDRYRQALFDNDGDTAYRLLDQETKDYYARMLDAARKASKSEVRQMPPVDKTFVLMSRALIPKKQLKKLNAKSYLKHGVEQGWFSQFAAENIEIADLKVEGDAAISHTRRGDLVVPYGFVFRRESDGWKLALTQLFPIHNEEIARYTESIGQTVDEFILAGIASVSGAEPSDDIWKPPL